MRAKIQQGAQKKTQKTIIITITGSHSTHNKRMHIMQKNFFGDDGMVNGFGEGTMGLDGMTKSFDGSQAFAKQFICSEQTFRFNMHKRINASASKRRGRHQMSCDQNVLQLCITCFHHNWNQIPIHISH